MAKLDIDGLHLRYGETPVLQGIDAHMQEGDVVCLLGRSGSGKTTLLRAIAGLEQPSAGRITIAGSVVVDADRGVFVLLDRRTPSRLLSAFPAGVSPRRVGLAQAAAETTAFLGGTAERGHRAPVT